MKEIFDEILETFENDDIKEFMEKKCIPTIPAWFWGAPASSSLKYHPAYACTTPLGLAKHTVAVARFLNHMFNVESVANQFTSKERDLLRVAALMHDTRKSGTQEDYEKSHYTKFDHPLQAAAVVRSLDGLPKEEIELIAHVIESHMGQWCTDKRHPDLILPKPTDKHQIILHIADYLASRKDIEVKFENLPKADSQPLPNVSTWQMNFGKYKGMTLPEIEALHPDYIAWIQKQEEFDKEPCKSLLIQMGYKFNN